VDVAWFILVGLSAGWLAGQIMGTGDHGLVGDLVVGVIGALLGGFLYRAVGVAVGSGLLGSLIVATGGALTLIAGLRLVRRL
jgi:uncharacterized membrane protein YeaQ/YmgE (transglycosylase-associated protein family)